MSDEPDLDAGRDPAVYAAARPGPVVPPAAGPLGDAPAEPDDAVHAIGVGPGNESYLTARAREALGEADVVVGFETVVDVIRGTTDADLLACGYRDEGATLAEFGDRVADGDRGAAVLMGDPNHSGYQFLGKVETAVDRPVRVVPGISSLQIAASRARTPMEDSAFVTLHKSGSVTADLDRLRGAVGDRHLLVLPRPFDLMPGDVAEDLLGAGADPDLTALVLERLTHPEESITRTTLAGMAEHAGEETPFSDLSVLVVRAPVTGGES